MTSKEILGASMLDILFDNRNKTYGAYELRRNYNSRLLMAMGSALGFVFLLLLLISNNNRTATSAIPPESPEVMLSSHFIPPIIEELPPIDEKPAAPKPPKTQEASFSIITMVDAPDPEKEMAAISDVEKSAIGTTNKLDGPENVSLQSSVPIAPALGGKGSGKEDEQSGFIAIEEQPEFPGGAVAWKNFLSRYLQVPASLNGGELKTVKINFMVDVDGSVTGFHIIQSAGREFDNEVIRVLKKMPKWKPAMQNGRPVSVPFTQPVTFVGVEQ